DRLRSICLIYQSDACNGNYQRALKSSQHAWLEERDKSIKLISMILDIKYADQRGTMYQLMRAGDSNDLVAPIVKQRALILKAWLEYLKTPADS
ncbi:MAG: lysozyme inhibitor LprI family protein, partial [Candidatus Competibacteraceae bacterium]|nr:lysozyme inhibitor LprI family protein [Candidatus Competibacteraceae bacterium]